MFFGDLKVGERFWTVSGAEKTEYIKIHREEVPEYNQIHDYQSFRTRYINSICINTWKCVYFPSDMKVYSEQTDVLVTVLRIGDREVLWYFAEKGDAVISYEDGYVILTYNVPKTFTVQDLEGVEVLQ